MEQLDAETRARIEKEMGRTTAIGEAAGIEATIWAIDGTEFDQPHPWPEARFVAVTADPFWVETPRPYTAAIMGPRWLDLWLAVDLAVVASGDAQHCFIEGFALDGDTLHVGLGS